MSGERQAPIIVLSPHGRLFIEAEDLGKHIELSQAFAMSSGVGLLYLDVATDAAWETTVDSSIRRPLYCGEHYPPFHTQGVPDGLV